jgi:hypothetical protein
MLSFSSNKLLSAFGFTFALAGAVGCGDDTSGDTSTTGGTTATTATTTTTATTAGGGGAGGDGAGGGGGAGGNAPFEQNALIRGTLAAADLATAKMQHDAIASGGEAQAKAAGDFGHDALLGTTLLGTTENKYLGFDRWETDQMDVIYDDPGFQQAFGALFSPPPSLEKFERNFDWHGWGDLTSGDAFDPYYFIVVRGRLKDADLAAAQANHDAIVDAGQTQATAAGDVAHVAFLGLADSHEYLAIDIWKTSDGLEAFYSDPDLQAAFASLFEGAPTLEVYGSTDWHQW